MASPTEKFDADILPDPELNPLLNPVLGAHMGRWAEVYFTNPPEKRAQAVFELLRELGNEAPQNEASPAVSSHDLIQGETSPKQTEAHENPEPLRSAAESERVCPICFHSNRAEHKFCGMCGGPLDVPVPAEESNVAETAAISGAPGSAPQSFVSHDLAPYAANSADHSGYGESFEFFAPDRPLSARDVPQFNVHSESVPYRYRLYIGAALALLFAILVYNVWHGSAASGDSSAARAVSPAPAAASPEPSQARPPDATPTPVAPTPQSAAPALNPPAPKQNPAESNALAAQPLKRQPASPRIVPVAAMPTAISTEQGGAQEYETAEKYMNNNPRVPRDNREAAEWLWKAVAKGNLAASLALSDLYLRGDGVPKNCDQARLLLDAAAKKGKAAAAERLRNLQAFGCS